jgi:hypothetical protein
MRSLQSEYPGIVVLMTYCLSYVPEGWELEPYFVNGMLDVLGPDVRIVEGDEESYHWGSTNKWFARYTELKTGRTGLQGFLAPENAGRYERQVEIGKAVYPELAYRPPSDLSPEQKDQKLQHNMYTGMACADRYVWIHTERQNLLGTPPEEQPAGWGVEPVDWRDATENMRIAIEKYRSFQPLGWDMRSSDLWRTGVPDASISVSVTASSGEDLMVSASVRGADVTEVRFYCNAVEVATDTTAPSMCRLQPLAAGEYTLMARAISRAGKHGTSAPVRLTVTRNR